MRRPRTARVAVRSIRLKRVRTRHRSLVIAGVRGSVEQTMDLTDALRSSPARTAASAARSRGAGERPLRLMLAGVRDPDAFEPITGRARSAPCGWTSPAARRSTPAPTRCDDGRRPARQQRRPDDRRAARGAGHGRGLRDVPGQPGRGRPPDAARAPGHARARARHDRQQRLDQRPRLLPRRHHLRRLQGGRRRLTDSLPRELDGTGVRALQLVTPGVDTDMLDATEEVYGRHMDTSGGTRSSRRSGRTRCSPRSSPTSDRRPGRGCCREARLARPGFLVDAISGRMFSRQPQR